LTANETTLNGTTTTGARSTHAATNVIHRYVVFEGDPVATAIFDRTVPVHPGFSASVDRMGTLVISSLDRDEEQEDGR
jgi:hypothetical protein